MRINAPTTSSTIPFHIAKAYGVPANAQASRVQRAPEAQAFSAPQNVQNAAAPLTPGGRSLIAGVVPGKVDFSGDTPRPSQPAQSLQIYRHPADRNAIATSVELGGRLDVNG